MKKKIIITFGIILLILIAACFLIPTPTLFQQTIVRNYSNAIERGIKLPVKNWFPYKAVNDSVFVLDGEQYIITPANFPGYKIVNKTAGLEGTITTVNISPDSTLVQWQYDSVNHTSIGISYAWKIEKQMNIILKSLASFLSDNEKIYGWKFTIDKFENPKLIYTEKQFTHQPATADIYGVIASLKNYIRQQHGEEADYPMLNILAPDSQHYTVRLAIALKENIPQNDTFILKSMVLGKVLKATVKGGAATVETAQKNMQHYLTDFNLESPAMPFEQLVTDRLAEKDTSRWITYLRYPVY